MSYSIKTSYTKIWTPGSIDDIRTFFKENHPTNEEIQNGATQEFEFENGDVESNAFYIEHDITNTTYSKRRVYCSLVRSNKITRNFACCGYITHSIGSSAPQILIKKNDNNITFEFYVTKEKYNKGTNSYEVDGNKEWVESITTGVNVKANTTAYLNINCPFFPIFENEDDANAYIQNPDTKAKYKKALNYYDATSGKTYNTDKYLYTTLPTLMPTFLDIAKEEGYSSGGFIDNVLNPLNDLITQFKSINYTKKINSVKQKRAKKTKEFTHFNSMELIMKVPATRGQIPFPSSAPLRTKLDYTIFTLSELQEMITFVQNNLQLPIKKERPFILIYSGNGGTVGDESYYHTIRVVHPAVVDGVSNIKIVNADGKAQDIKYYFETYDTSNNNLRLLSDDSTNFEHADFNFYPNKTGNNRFDNWDVKTPTSGDILKHKDQITLNAINTNVPFYCSDTVYIRYKDKNKEWLRKELYEQGISRDDSTDSDPTFAGMVHIKPIITLYNRYEMSNINGWDGNKLKLGDGYLLAPQVGAGLKDNGQFTGVVMGIKQLHPNSTTNQKIGLIGFHQGIESFFLNSEDGSALFGKSGSGQIVIDPSSDKGYLYSYSFWKNYNEKTNKPNGYTPANYSGEGMLIDLTTPEIRYGNGNFVVDKDGNTTIAGGGGLAGWKITDITIESNITAENGKLVLDSGATLLGQDSKGNKTYSYSFGKIYSGNHNTINSLNDGFYLSKEGLSIGDTIRITAAEGGQVLVGRVNNGGNYWTISGNSSRSYIGYAADTFGCTHLDDPIFFTITGNTNSVYIGTEGIRLGKKFAVDNTGNLLTKHLVVNCGSTDAESSWIGNWQFTNANMGAVEQVSSSQWDRLWFSTHGVIRAEKWNVRPFPGGQEGVNYEVTWAINPDGTATFSTVNIPTNKNMNVAGTLTVTGSLLLNSNNIGNAFTSTGFSGTIKATNFEATGDITAGGTITSTGGTFTGALTTGSYPITCGNLTGAAISGTSIEASSIGTTLLSVLDARYLKQTDVSNVQVVTSVDFTTHHTDTTMVLHKTT